MDIKELVDLCKKGNEQALSLLYKTYSKKMMRICLHYIPDKQIAQDLRRTITTNSPGSPAKASDQSQSASKSRKNWKAGWE